MKKMVFFSSGVLGALMLWSGARFCQDASKDAESDSSKLCVCRLPELQNGRPVASGVA